MCALAFQDNDHGFYQNGARKMPITKVSMTPAMDQIVSLALVN